MEKQEKSHSAAVHSSGHIHLTTQRAHFQAEILCVVWQTVQAKKKEKTKIYCACVYSGELWMVVPIRADMLLKNCFWMRVIINKPIKLGKKKIKNQL